VVTGDEVEADLITAKSCCARGIISAMYGRRRRTGAASRPRIGGGNKMPPTLGAGARRASAAALRTTFSRQGAVRGRASWPRLRRHLADKIGLPCPKDDQGKVFTRFPLDVTRSSVELYPGNSEVFRFLKNRQKNN